MNVFLIIVLSIIVIAISSVNFRPGRNKQAIKALSERKAKAAQDFIEIYPGFHLFWSLVSLLATIWITCLAALSWGLVAGCFIALIIIALAKLLGARLTNLADELLVQNAGVIVKYFKWTEIFNSLVTGRADDPLEDTDELVELLHNSHIDCPTQLAIEKTIKLRSEPVESISTKWANVNKIGYRDRLTPKRIDELFQSGQKVFPVIRNDENDIVGLLHFNDISTIGSKEKHLLSSMQRNFATCEVGTSIDDVLHLMAENETTVAVVMKNKKVQGLVTLSDILAIKPICE